MEWKRKAFSSQEYDKRNQDAFDFLKRDITSSSNYYPVLREEDYDIDVALYTNEKSYKRNERPIAFIELEIKAERRYSWKIGEYPFPDIHFLYRKLHLIHQEAISFWVCYNSGGTDCVTVPMEAIPSYPIGQNTSQYGDLVITVPVQLCTFGPKNIIPAIEEYVKNQTQVHEKLFRAAPEFYFSNANKAYQSRHKYQETCEIQKELTLQQRKNNPPIGIKSYL